MGKRKRGGRNKKTRGDEEGRERKGKRNHCRIFCLDVIIITK